MARGVCYPIAFPFTSNSKFVFFTPHFVVASQLVITPKRGLADVPGTKRQLT